MSAKSKPAELGPGAVIFYWVVVVAGSVFAFLFINAIITGQGHHPLIALPAVFAIPATGRLFEHYRYQFQTWRATK